MSSTSDAYQYLLVQTLPKSILKKSPSPRFSDKSVQPEHEHSPNIAASLPAQAEKNDSSDNQSAEKHILLLSPVDEPIMASNKNSSMYEVDHRLMRTVPCADSSSSSLTSDDEQQKRVKTKTKKIASRLPAANGARSSSISSSDSNDERKVKRSVPGSKLAGLRSDTHRHKDMQLDEFMRKYQQHGGIHVPTTEDHGDDGQTSAPNPTNNEGNNYQQSSITHHRTPQITNDAGDDDDTTGFLTTMNILSASMSAPSSLQLLLDVAHTDRCDRRTKIDRLRQYVEEQIGISPFLTIYKLIKSSQIPVDIRQKPFCYYAKFLPHLCCLIMLESEEQRNRL